MKKPWFPNSKSRKINKTGYLDVRRSGAVHWWIFDKAVRLVVEDLGYRMNIILKLHSDNEAGPWIQADLEYAGKLKQ